MAALRAALAERGVPVDAVAINLDASAPMVWLHVAPAGGASQWMGVTGDLVISDWSWRVALGLGLGLALLAGMSWGFTRWLTRPLEQLSTRMSLPAPGGVQTGPSQTLGGIRVAPEIARLDAAFSDLLARQAQHERERAVLLAGVSHDLRSPLGRIRVAAELLPDTPDNAPRRASIIRNVAEADRLTESFLDFVRTSELTLDETVDLAAAARTAATRFERSSQELRVDAPDALPVPRCNRLLIERLLANLLDNAFKHGRTPVHLRVAQQAREAWLEVMDAGDGVPPAARQLMLEAFTRGDPSRAAPGTGLGLAIVRQVAARMGGSVSFVDEAGGHGVRVSLPRVARRE
jgi:two-component system osmolarity sensor histidine kinase EnvZ